MQNQIHVQNTINFHISSPVMSLEQFAQASGIKLKAAEHMWDKGELPRASCFKGRRMVNMLKLSQNLLAAEY